MPPNAEERRAAIFIVVLFAAGVVVRLLAGNSNASPGGVAFQPRETAIRPERDSVAAQAARLASPLRRGEKVDMDTATELDLTRLPRIGPALARRIVEDRRRSGPFGSLTVLQRVPGIGPRLIETLRPYATFSAVRTMGRPRAVGPARLSLNRATAAELSRLPGIGPVRAAAIVAHRRRSGPFRSVDDLVAVAGIGPGTVERIRARVRVP